MEKLPPIKTVTPAPGDRFVVQTKDYLPTSAHSQIQQAVAQTLGVPQAQVLVLDGGLSLTALRLMDQRREADLIEANNRAHNRNAELSFALGRAVQTFGLYAELHLAKGTQEGVDKAAANRRMAQALEEALKVNSTGSKTVGSLTIKLAADATTHKALTRALDFMAWVAQSPVLGSEDEELDAAGLSDHARLELESIMASLGEEAPAQDAAYKPTAMTEAGSIAAGGSALVKAFLHSGRGDVSPAEVDALHQFAAFAVDQLKARTVGADFQITPPPKPSDASAVVTVDFGKGRGHPSQIKGDRLNPDHVMGED